MFLNLHLEQILNNRIKILTPNIPDFTQITYKTFVSFMYITNQNFENSE